MFVCSFVHPYPLKQNSSAIFCDEKLARHSSKFKVNQEIPRQCFYPNLSSGHLQNNASRVSNAK